MLPDALVANPASGRCALKLSLTLCYREPMRWVAGMALGLALATVVYSQPMRMLPANSKLGELTGRQHAFPLVQIGGEVLRLSAGAIIFDESNRSIVHGVLPAQATVLYVQEPGGAVSRIYILRPEELERIRRARER